MTARPALRGRALLLLTGSAVATAVATLVGFGIGSHPIPVATVVEAILDYDPQNADHVIVLASRIPRVVLGVIVGAGLGAAGALMQSLTRNPLADPGILGVSNGASFAVVVGLAFFGTTSAFIQMSVAIVGAAVAAVFVYTVGSLGRGRRSSSRWRERRRPPRSPRSSARCCCPAWIY